MPIEKIRTLQIEKEAKKISLTPIRVRKGAILIFIIILIVAVLGFTGSGLWEGGEKRDEISGWSIEYNKYLHNQSLTTLKIKIKPFSFDKKSIEIWFNQNYLSKFLIPQILPSPQSVRVMGEKIIFQFNVDTTKFNVIHFFIEPQTFGLMKAKIGMSKRILNFYQFVYP